jgi:prophage antirepressor-like protein
METNNIALFKGKQIRRLIYNNEWWFSVVDVVAALTDSTNANDYWYKMKIRVKDEDGFELSTICRWLKLLAPDGKMRETDCANTEGIFVSSNPSLPPKRSLLKRPASSGVLGV